MVNLGNYGTLYVPIHHVPTRYSLDTSIVYCERRSAKIHALERVVNLFYLLATTATGQVAFRGWARLVRVRWLRQILP